MEPAASLIIGIGNEWRGDDAVGLIAAGRLREACFTGVEIREMGGDGAELIEAWRGKERVIVIDAMRSGAAPGTILSIEADSGPLPAGLAVASSHQFGLAEAVELSRALGTLPRRLLILAIEGSRFEPGVPPTAEVLAAVESLPALVQKYVG